MSVLKPEDVKHIVWHTAAHGSGSNCYKTTVAQIDEWHRDRGFDGIGYHFVVYNDDTASVHTGRDINKMGAHVEGINHKSVGICFSGHGDICRLTDKQLENGIKLTIELLDKFNLRQAFLRGDNVGMTVMGHREVNALVAAGLASKRTDKTCPGTRVDMNTVRQMIRDRIGVPVAPDPAFVFDAAAAGDLLKAVRSVYDAANRLKLDDESMKSLNAFRKDKNVNEIIERAKALVG